jgi:hypothetical protein
MFKIINCNMIFSQESLEGPRRKTQFAFEQIMYSYI